LSDTALPGSIMGRTSASVAAISTSTTTSELMTKASEKRASGPLARVCDRMASVADGLRLTASTPHNRPTPISALSPRFLVNATCAPSAVNRAACVVRTSNVCTSVCTPRLRARLRTSAMRSSRPPARAISASASVLTISSRLTVA
jgi:hypothetical protein